MTLTTITTAIIEICASIIMIALIPLLIIAIKMIGKEDK